MTFFRELSTSATLATPRVLNKTAAETTHRSLIPNPSRSRPPPPHPATFLPAFLVSSPHGWTLQSQGCCARHRRLSCEEKQGKQRGSSKGQLQVPFHNLMYVTEGKHRYGTCIAPYGIQHRLSALQLDAFPKGSSSNEECKCP